VLSLIREPCTREKIAEPAQDACAYFVDEMDFLVRGDKLVEMQSVGGEGLLALGLLGSEMN